MNGLNGRSKANKIGLPSEKEFSEILPFLTGLDQREIRVVEAILNKAPSETRDQVAEQLGISRRQLYNLTRHSRNQESQTQVADAFPRKFLFIFT